MRKYGKLMVALMACIMVFAMTACGGSDSATPAAEPSATDEAVAALTESLDAFKNTDLDAINEMTGGSLVEETQESLGGDSKTTEQLIKAAFGHMEYTIGDAEEVDENTVNVKVKIKNVNMGMAVKEMYAGLITYVATHQDVQEDDGQLAAKVIELLADAVEKTAEEEDGIVEKEVTVKMVKEDDQWKVDESADGYSDVIDALTGGITDAFSSLTGGASGDR